MAEKWTVSLRTKIHLKSMFGGNISFTASAIDRALKRDQTGGDSWVYEEDRGVALYKWKRAGRAIYEVVELDLDYRGNVVTILEYWFDREPEAAISCFMGLVKSPVKLKKKGLPGFYIATSASN